MPSPSEIAAENRRKYPRIAEVVDLFRAEFGEVRVLCACDVDGNRVGKPPAHLPTWFEDNVF
jgi:hypothetical protein